jgi:hypothetical protein
VSDPEAEDLRLHLIAARVGLTHGWSRIYDIDLQREAASALGPSGRVIDAMHLYVSPPVAAWIFAPLAWQRPAVGYLVWTLISLAAFIGAAWLILPGSRLIRVTLLLISLGVWPVHYQFWAGQTVAATLALLALSYWLLERDRPVLSGMLMAFAFCLKPQDALLLPLALLVSGRWRPVAAFAATGSAIAAVSAVSLGQAGIAGWLDDISIIRANPFNSPLTYSFIVGRNGIATGIAIVLGFAALAIAWYRRDRLDLVFSIALVGTMVSATYLHEFDIAMLVLAAWVVLKAQPSLTQRIWLVAGIAAAQFIAIGLPTPLLLWEPAWMAILALEPWLRRRETIGGHHQVGEPLALESTLP